MKNLRCPLWLVVLSVLLALGYSAQTEASGRPRLVESLDVRIPRAPVPFSVVGTTRFAYEVHLTNYSRSDAELVRMTVRDAKGTSLLELQGATLEKVLHQSSASSARLLSVGAHTVVFVWLTLPSAAPSPDVLFHEIDLEWLRPQSREPARFRSEPLRVSHDHAPVLGPPLRGGPWVALYDPTLPRGHRTFIYTLDGRARIPARYAIDWVRLAPDGSYASEDNRLVANWHGYGEDVLAVADGIVVEAMDDMASADTIGASQGSMPLEAASGNYIVLDIGAGRYAFYEHLLHGSVRVKRGDRVRRGDVIAALGNSGSSSSGPHLHFHLADAPSTLAAEGLPFVFESFEVLGKFATIQDFSTGERWRPVPPQEGGRRATERPDANVVLMFTQ